MWAGSLLTNEVSPAVKILLGKVPQWGRVQIENFCAVLLLQDCTSRCPQGEGWETITASFSRVMQVIATSTTLTLTFFILLAPLPTEAQQVLIRSQDTHSWQGWQTNECSMQSQAETDTHSQVYLFFFSLTLFFSNTNCSTYTCSHTVRRPLA